MTVPRKSLSSALLPLLPSLPGLTTSQVSCCSQQVETLSRTDSLPSAFFLSTLARKPFDHHCRNPQCWHAPSRQSLRVVSPRHSVHTRASPISLLDDSSANLTSFASSGSSVAASSSASPSASWSDGACTGASKSIAMQVLDGANQNGAPHDLGT